MLAGEGEGGVEQEFVHFEVATSLMEFERCMSGCFRLGRWSDLGAMVAASIGGWQSSLKSWPAAASWGDHWFGGFAIHSSWMRIWILSSS